MGPISSGQYVASDTLKAPGLRVLMIERNSALRRNVLLEAKELASLGATVDVVCWPGQEVSGKHFQKIIRVPLLPRLERAANKTRALSAWQVSLLGKLPPKPKSLLQLLLNPEAGKEMLLCANSLSRLETHAGFLGLTALTPRAGLGNWIRRLGFYSKGLMNAVAQHITGGGLGLDPWEMSVLESLKGTSYDVVHVHDLPCLPLGVALKRELGARLIYDAHEFYPHQLHFSERARAKFDRMERTLLRHCDAIVVVNEKQLEFMRMEGVSAEIIVLPNALESSSDRPTSANADLKALLKLPAETPLLVFQGVLTRNRNVHELVEGLRHAKTPAHVVFLTWPSEIPGMQAFADSHGVGDRVHFAGPFAWDRVVELVASADGGVIPYQPVDPNAKYSLPNKLYEFIEAEVPILANSDLHFVGKIVESEGFGIAHSLRSANDYGAAIDRFFESPESLLGFRRNMREKKKLYSWEASVAQFRTYYEGLIEDRATRANGLVGSDDVLSGSVETKNGNDTLHT